LMASYRFLATTWGEGKGIANSDDPDAIGRLSKLLDLILPPSNTARIKTHFGGRR